jgi:hypothetical protein
VHYLLVGDDRTYVHVVLLRFGVVLKLKLGFRVTGKPVHALSLVLRVGRVELYHAGPVVVYVNKKR